MFAYGKSEHPSLDMVHLSRRFKITDELSLTSVGDVVRLTGINSFNDYSTMNA